MGTDLYKITVQNVAGAEAWLDCQKLVADDAIPAAENFGLHLLLDAYEASPVSTHPMREKLERWLTLANGVRQVLPETEYQAMVAGIEAWSVFGVLSHGMQETGAGPEYSVTYRPDHRAFVRAANNEIGDISLLPSTRPDSLIVHLEVFEAALLQHLKPGATFVSRAYDHEGFI